MDNANKSNRTESVKIRLTLREKEMLQQKATEAGQSSVSSYIRYVALCSTASPLHVMTEIVEVNNALNEIYHFTSSSGNKDIEKCCDVIFDFINREMGV